VIVQVVILDRHPLSDGRVERHMNTVSGHGFNVLRVKFPNQKDGVRIDRGSLSRKGVLLVPRQESKHRLLDYAMMGLLSAFPSLLADFFVLKHLRGLDNQQETILHCHDPETLGLARHMQKKHFLRASIVYDRHEVFEAAAGLYGLSAMFFEKLFKRHVGGVVNQSNIYEESDRLLFPDAAVVSVPNYPVHAEYDHGKIVEKIGGFSKGSDIVLNYIGSLNYEYDRDVGLLLEIFEKALADNDRVKVVLGGATDSEELLHEIGRLGEEYGDRFVYLGYVPRDEVRRLAEESHVGFFLIRPRGKYWMTMSPNKLYEHLVTGNVFVLRASVDMDTSPECILDYERESSNEKIVEDVLDLLNDTERMKRLMSSAYDFGKKYRYEDVEHRYMELYEKLLKDSEG